MSDPMSAPSSSPLHALLETWTRTRDVELEAAKRLDPGTRERELLEESADTYDSCIGELEATLTAAPQTPICEQGWHKPIDLNADPRVCATCGFSWPNP